MSLLFEILPEFSAKRIQDVCDVDMQPDIRNNSQGHTIQNNINNLNLLKIS